MILIGQYDSPFVRRVAVTLRHYALPYEHRNWSVWRNANEIARYNPLRRVPVLVLEDGTSLVETFVIIEALDELVGPGRALLPRSGSSRRDGLRIAALATGFADKAVSMLYEGLFRRSPSEVWIQRCREQITDTLGILEAERAARSSPYWLGDALTHADIAFTCAIRFTREAHPGLFDQARFPHLDAQASRCEALDEFAAVVQPIVNNL